MLKSRCSFRKQVFDHDLTAYNRLRTAIKCKDEGLVQKLVHEGAPVNGVYDGGYKEFDPTEEPYDDDARTDNPSFTPLHLAVMSRNAEIVKILLNKGADMNARVWNGDTPLTMAAKMQDTTIVDLLLAHDSIQNSSHHYDRLSHLHIACMRNNVTVAQKLLLMNQGREINKQVDEASIHWAGWTPLHFAAYFESVETVQYLLSCGAEITVLDGMHCSPLHLAHLNWNETIMDLLLEAHKTHFDNPKNLNGLSHFHIACTRDNASVVEHFLRFGSDVNDQVSLSSPWPCWKPIHFAMLYERQNVIELLLRNKKVHLKDRYFAELLENAYFTGNGLIYDPFMSTNFDPLVNEGCQELSLLHRACIRDKARKIEGLMHNNLISIPTDFDRPIRNGWTAVHLAVKCESQSVLRVLLDKGASIVAQDTEGRTPFHLAFKSNPRSLCLEILKNLATVSLNVTDHEGLSIFHILCALGCMEAIQRFILEGVNINSQVRRDSVFYAGFTPLHFAVKFDKPDVVDILLKYGADVSLTDSSNLNPFDTAVHSMSKSNYFFRIQRSFKILMRILTHASDEEIQLNHRGISIWHGLSILEEGELGQWEEYLTTHADELNRAIEFPPWLGYTPLHVATICFNRFDLTELLLKNGADPGILNGTRNSFIEGAFLFGMPDGLSFDEAEKLFVIASKYGDFADSCFHLACSLGLLHVVKSLLDGIDDQSWRMSLLSLRNDLGRTPLHSFMLADTDEDKDKIANLMLRNGADIYAKDFELQTPLHHAQLELEPNLTRVLIDFGGEVNAQNVFGQTPLHILLQTIRTLYTVENSSVTPFYDQITLLLEGGSDINIIDSRGLTPLMIIPHSENEEPWEGISRILLKHLKKLQLISRHIDDYNKMAYSRMQDDTLHAPILDENSFVQTCEQELAAMQLEYIDHYTNLYSILFKSQNRMAGHCENDSLQRMIQSIEFISKFPLYGFLIKLQVKEGQIRRPLLIKSKKIIRLIFDVYLPNQCIDTILDYLSNSDLENIIKII